MNLARIPSEIHGDVYDIARKMLSKAEMVDALTQAYRQRYWNESTPHTADELAYESPEAYRAVVDEMKTSDLSDFFYETMILEGGYHKQTKMIYLDPLMSKGYSTEMVHPFRYIENIKYAFYAEGYFPSDDEIQSHADDVENALLNNRKVTIAHGEMSITVSPGRNMVSITTALVESPTRERAKTQISESLLSWKKSLQSNNNNELNHAGTGLI